MEFEVLDLEALDPSAQGLVGGKASNLATLRRIDGANVPPGFCVTTAALRLVLDGAPACAALAEGLARLDPEDHAAIRAQSAALREAIEGLPMPDDLSAAILDAHARLGPDTPCAVRSSATGEDGAQTSFAGLQDSFLNVVGPAAVLHAVRRCLASLYTERAVIYRLRHGIRDAAMAVLVQRMVPAEASGVLFTADPLHSNRKLCVIEAVPGLGEALVSGQVIPQRWELRADQVVGGPSRPDPLTEAQAVALARLGRRIEAHFGAPQDIEWCLAAGAFHLVQSRPITTLFPLPAAPDERPRVYVSVGHGQMMTDAMSPLGLSLYRAITPAPMVEAGGRLWLDATAGLSAQPSRAAMLAMFGRGDPLLRDALDTVLARPDLLPPLPEAPPAPPPSLIEADPTLPPALMARADASIEAARQALRDKSGSALLELVFADIQELRRVLFDPQSSQAVMAGIQASWWLNDQLLAWLGEKGAADALSWSVPHNPTAEMGLALLDVADAVRPHPEVVAALERACDAGFLDELPALPGGLAARDAIQGWLERYGCRGVGEIDIARPRWGEQPATLAPLILSHVRAFAPGEAARRFARGAQAAEERARALLARLEALPDGEARAEQARSMIARVRAFMGYREFPKYAMIRRYALYKAALLGEADRLVAAGVIAAREDIFSLSLAELAEVVRTGVADRDLIRARQAEHRAFQPLRPPRVLTSDGEALNGVHRRQDLPAGALLGTPVSAGTVEGRAVVVQDPSEARLERGDILVTTATDPSWTPLFVTIGGLVTEVGGQMTHGSVIAREYGLPAVVGVDRATARIQHGQRVRVHGTEGFVEILDG